MLAAVGQLCSTNNVARNTALCVSLIRRAAAARCAILYLPEAADFIADAKEVPKLSEPLDTSEFVRRVRAQAKESAMWVGVGVHEKATQDKCYNTNLVRTLLALRAPSRVRSPLESARSSSRLTAKSLRRTASCTCLTSSTRVLQAAS